MKGDKERTFKLSELSEPVRLEMVLSAVKEDDADKILELVGTLKFPIEPSGYDWVRECEAVTGKPRESDGDGEFGPWHYSEVEYRADTWAERSFNYRNAILLAADLEKTNALKQLMRLHDGLILPRVVHMAKSRPQLKKLLLEEAITRDEPRLLLNISKNECITSETLLGLKKFIPVDVLCSLCKMHKALLDNESFVNCILEIYKTANQTKIQKLQPTHDFICLPLELENDDNRWSALIKFCATSEIGQALLSKIIKNDRVELYKKFWKSKKAFPSLEFNQTYLLKEAIKEDAFNIFKEIFNLIKSCHKSKSLLSELDTLCKDKPQFKTFLTPHLPPDPAPESAHLDKRPCFFPGQTVDVRGGDGRTYQAKIV